MNHYYFCFDIGGTDIKGGILDEHNNILYQDKIETQKSIQQSTLADVLLNFANQLAKTANVTVENCSGFGIGIPGLIDGNLGVIKYSACLNLKDYPLAKELKKHIKVPIKIANDAELATLAEMYYGNGKNRSSFALLTIGTGIGCGIVIKGVSIRQINPFACEFGHNFASFSNDVEYEQIASTKALILQTKEAMKQNKNSKMWTKYNLDSVCGETIFEFKDADETARQVFENYIKNLGDGIVNLYNTFAPQVIILGGGISAQKSKLTAPLETYVNKHIFTKNISNKVHITTSKFLNGAGLVGVKCLFN